MRGAQYEETIILRRVFKEYGILFIPDFPVNVTMQYVVSFIVEVITAAVQPFMSRVDWNAHLSGCNVDELRANILPAESMFNWNISISGY